MVNFHFQHKRVKLDRDKIAEWIKVWVSNHQRALGFYNMIFCTNQFILDINRNYLQHNYYTDIITFPYNQNPIEAEVYISIERVKEQAKEWNQSFEQELLRVIIHGVNHMLGYNDKSVEDKRKMRIAEDKALDLYNRDLRQEGHYYDQVYDLVRLIPEGRVSNYGALATFLSLGSARMVGWALNQLKNGRGDIPAHRVVNSKGVLSGKMFFAPGEMEKKLKLEGITVIQDKIQNFDALFWDPSKEIKI